MDVILNPLGVPSRMNIGQILETHLGWAAAAGLVRRRHRGLQARPGGRQRQASTSRRPVFDGATVADVDHALVQWQKGHKGAIRMDIDEKRRVGEKASRQVHALQRPLR